MIQRLSAALVKFAQGIGANFASRTVMDKLRDTVFIHDFYKPEDGDDWGIALNRAFEYGQNLTSLNVQFRAQDYIIRTQAVYDGTANISLLGYNGTKLYLNNDGLAPNILIKSVRRITLQNFQYSVLAPTVDGVKVGIQLRCTGQDRSPTVHNVIGETTITTAGRSVIMMDFINFALGSVRDTYARYFGELANVRFSNNIAFRVSSDGSSVTTDSIFDSCQVINAEYAWSVTPPALSPTAALEGVTWKNPTVVGCLYGISVTGDRSNPYRSPMYRILGGHIQAYRSCVVYSWISQITIANANLYLAYLSSRSGGEGHTAIVLDEVYQGHISHVSFNLFNQQDDFGRGVQTLSGCRSIQVTACSAYADRQCFALISNYGSVNTRALGNAAYYPSASSASSSVRLDGSQDEDLGGNTARVG